MLTPSNDKHIWPLDRPDAPRKQKTERLRCAFPIESSLRVFLFDGSFFVFSKGRVHHRMGVTVPCQQPSVITFLGALSDRESYVCESRLSFRSIAIVI